MRPLLTAILKKFQDAGLGESITGGAFLIRAPKGAQMPYAVLTPIFAPVDTTYGAKPYVASVQWGVFGNTGADALAGLLASLCAAFDDQLLTLESGANHHVDREGEPLIMQEPESQDKIQPDPVRGWGGFVTYQYGVTP
jgi:hypothetical protein